VAELLNLKVFIDAKDYIKLQRRLKRDREERGYDADDVLYKYENHIMPSFQKYIAPYKETADLIVPNNTDFQNALDVLKAVITSKIPVKA
jgi:uridine kinase